MRVVATSDPASADRHWHELALVDDQGDSRPLEATVDSETGEVKLSLADQA